MQKRGMPSIALRILVILIVISNLVWLPPLKASGLEISNIMQRTPPQGENDLIARELLRPDLTYKHRALMITSNINNYHLTASEQLAAHGFGVEMTNYTQFVNHVNEWMDEYDIFIIATHAIEIPYFYPVTAAQFKAALTTWVNAGKKTIICTSTTYHAIRKLDVAGNAAESVTISDLFPATIANVNYTGTGSFVHAGPYPFGSEEVLVDTVNIKPNSFSNHFYNYAPAEVAIQATEGANNAHCVIFKAGSYSLIGWGGSSEGNIPQNAGWRYVNIGLIAKHLIGETTSTVSMATDCKYSRKIVATGIDCDLSNDINAIQPIVDAYGDRVFELGMVSAKTSAEVASWLRSQQRHIEFVSHSKTHTTAPTFATVTDELWIIPVSQVVRLKNATRVTITNVKTQDDVTTFTNGGNFNSAIVAGKYGYDDHGRLKFNVADVGKAIKVSYTCLYDAEEWLSSLDDLRNLGLLTSESVYLTAGRNSVSAETMAYCLKKDIQLCAYIGNPENTVMDYILYENLISRMPPLVGPTFVDGHGVSSFDGIFMNTKENAKATVVPKRIARIKSLRLPYVWYSHDFVFSETSPYGIWTNDPARYNSDWKRATYAETVAYTQEMIEWILAQLDLDNVYYMGRSDYSRWFNDMMRYVRYNIESEGLIIQNTGPRTLKGLTFREMRDAAPTSVKALPDTDLTYSYANGELLFHLDLLPGQAVLVKIK